MNKTPRRSFDARLYERGNGLPSVGDYVCDGGDLYRVIDHSGRIETSGRKGNWMRGVVEPADWQDYDPEGAGREPACSCEIVTNDD